MNLRKCDKCERVVYGRNDQGEIVIRTENHTDLLTEGITAITCECGFTTYVSEPHKPTPEELEDLWREYD